MRYYYEDPLAATWMAKHFGMKFEGYDEIEIDMGEILSAALKPHDVRINYIVPSIFIIRLDSLHLLEPQEGDLVDDNTLYTRPIIRKIIQRTGIAFMWPKIEEEGGDVSK